MQDSAKVLILEHEMQKKAELKKIKETVVRINFTFVGFLVGSAVFFLLNQTTPNLTFYVLILVSVTTSLSLICISHQLTASIEVITEYYETSEFSYLKRNVLSLSLIISFLSIVILLLTANLVFSISIILAFILTNSNILKIDSRKTHLLIMLTISAIVFLGFDLIIILLGYNMILSLITIFIDAIVVVVFFFGLAVFLTSFEIEKKTEKWHSTLEDRIEEVFGKVCDLHPSTTLNDNCPICYRAYCDRCKNDYENLCIFCFRDTLDNKVTLGNTVTFLGILLVILFFAMNILGNNAPFHMVLRLAPWLPAYYARRDVILLYFNIAAILIIAIFLAGGSLYYRRLKIRIKDIEGLINQFNLK